MWCRTGVLVGFHQGWFVGRDEEVLVKILSDTGALDSFILTSASLETDICALLLQVASNEGDVQGAIT